MSQLYKVRRGRRTTARSYCLEHAKELNARYWRSTGKKGSVCRSVQRGDCPLCSQQLKLLSVPAVSRPAWFRPDPNAKRAADNVARGRHPMGAELGADDQTCGSCAHCYATGSSARTYFKCRLVPATSGPGTDIRKRWRACSRWQACT